MVGEIPQGGYLLVESSGSVVSGTGRFAGAAGRMASRSKVRLVGGFKLSVDLSLVLGSAGAVTAPRVATTLPRWPPAGLSDSSCLVSIGKDGDARLLYSSAFKRQLVSRLNGSPAIEPAALAASTGLSEAILSRWSREARQISAFSKVLPVPALFQQPRSFEERLGVVLRAASYSEETLEEFLAAEGVSKDEVDAWRKAIDTAIKNGGEESDASANPDEGANLEEIKELLEALLGGDDEATPKADGEAKSP